MTGLRSFLAGLLLCLACVGAEIVDLQRSLASTERNLQSAKTHVDNMLRVSSYLNQRKLDAIVNNGSKHLAYEIKKFADSLRDKMSECVHEPKLKEVVTAAVAQLHEAAASLDHVGLNLTQNNVKFFSAAERILQEAKNVVSTGQCDQLAPIVKAALGQLTRYVNNYQFGIHDLFWIPSPLDDI